MHWIGTPTLVNFLIFSIISVQLTTSASFPNPPQRPPSDASPDEQALFWKLLHNYYAIIARPRFGKRSDSSATYSYHPKDTMNHIFNENIPNDRIDIDNDYMVEYSDRRRR